MSTVVYIIRHGESEGNRRKAFLGHTDLPLTQKGREQASLAGGYLDQLGMTFDRVYASPLCRAYETAVIAASATGYTADPTPVTGLQEINAGEWENRSFTELMQAYPDTYGALWIPHIGLAQADGGESVAALSERVIASVLRLAEENPGRRLLIGTHATPLRAIETAARGLAVSQMEQVPWALNASLSAYHIRTGRILPLFYSLSSYLGDTATFFPKTV